ncbi:MAG: peptide ABC transporter substrate-binding protein, partial [Oscillospiraceae bacterium]|nr:peptide ABC transporter substrate-binding protein [Oscillospiraceae bacterium]
MKKKVVSLLALLICIALVAGLAACGPKTDSGGGGGGPASPGAPSSGEKILRVHTDMMQGTLDPAGNASITFVGYAPYALDKLVAFDDKGAVIYRAAESYETNADQTVWTFHLRENAKWSDGSPVKAEDFVNTVRNSLAPSAGSMYSGELYVLKGAEEAAEDYSLVEQVGAIAVDDFTLEFDLKYPCAYFLKLVTLPVFAPSKAEYAKLENTNWYDNPATSLGNGPFYMSEFVQDQKIVLKKNPYFYDAANVKLDGVVMTVIPDIMAAAAAYETGEVDIASGLLDTVMTQYEGKPDLNTWAMQTTVFVLANLDKAPVMQDVRVREAFAIGLKRADLCAAIGTDLSPSFSFVANQMVSNATDKKFSEERPQLFEEDIARAKQLLADAGYPDGAGFPELTYTYPSGGKNGDVAVA